MASNVKQSYDESGSVVFPKILMDSLVSADSSAEGYAYLKELIQQDTEEFNFGEDGMSVNKLNVSEQLDSDIITANNISADTLSINTFETENIGAETIKIIRYDTYQTKYVSSISTDASKPSDLKIRTSALIVDSSTAQFKDKVISPKEEVNYISNGEYDKLKLNSSSDIDVTAANNVNIETTVSDINLSAHHELKLQGGNVNIWDGNGSLSSACEYIKLNSANQSIDIYTNDGDGSVNIFAKDVSIYGRVKSTINGIDGVYSNTPIGTIVMWATDTAPEGWLLCDGKSYKTTEYSKLYKVIQKTFGGSGDTFKVPDFRGRFPMGKASSDTYIRIDDSSVYYTKHFVSLSGVNTPKIGDTSIYVSSQIYFKNNLIHTKNGWINGEYRHQLTINEMPSHTHDVSTNAGDNPNSKTGAFSKTDYDASKEYKPVKANVSSVGGSEFHNILPPFLTINFIIKYK